MYVQLIDEIVFDFNVDVSHRVFHFECECIYLFIKYLPKNSFRLFCTCWEYGNWIETDNISAKILLRIIRTTYICIHYSLTRETKDDARTGLEPIPGKTIADKDASVIKQYKCKNPQQKVISRFRKCSWVPYISDSIFAGEFGVTWIQILHFEENLLAQIFVSSFWVIEHLKMNLFCNSLSTPTDLASIEIRYFHSIYHRIESGIM